ncbi:MAG: hypothetical protein PHX70_09265 [Clostridium sp.]|nr:hypothetical protein [Clostridium sp.]
MNLHRLIGPSGFLVGLAFTISILNFFVKFINKTFVNKLDNSYKSFKVVYRKILKIVVKYHKIFGVLALLFLAIHFYVAYFSNKIKFSGIIAGFIMILVVLLGIYGNSISKNKRGSWLKLHRILAFILLATVALHLL